MQYTNIEKEIIRNIGEFYFNKYGEGESFLEKAKSAILELQITNVEYEEVGASNFVSITLGRPGILIGRKGENIEALQKFLSEKMKKNVTIKIIENNINDYLYWFMCTGEHCYDSDIDDSLDAMMDGVDK